MTAAPMCSNRRVNFPARCLRRARFGEIVLVVATVLSQGLAVGATPTQTEIDLSGEWQLALDPDDVGLHEQWFRPGVDTPFARTAKLPGSLESQRIGESVTVDTPWTGPISDRKFFTSPRYAPYRRSGHVKIPFFLQPETYYRGPAWRRTTVDIPVAWRNQRVVLELERCHWTTQAWFDGLPVGGGESLSTPHRFVLTNDAEPGAHDLVVRVDNRLLINVGAYAHSVTDHTQGNWNGVVGAVRLISSPAVWIDRVATFPNVRHSSVKVVVSMGNTSGREQRGRLKWSARPVARSDSTATKIVESTELVPKGGAEIVAELPLGDGAQLWDEFNPFLYELAVEWVPENVDNLATYTATTRFGMREVGVDGTQLTLNGRRLFLRGTLECNVFPLTGYPATDVASWKRIMHICREHGLNHIRFHSNCPPEAAFVAADDMGIYLQVECGVWANWNASIGRGEPVDDFLYREAERIIAEYGNHPSFLLMAHGNEPAGPKEGADYLTRWIDHFRSRDSRRLYTGGSGWPMIPANQYHVTAQPRIYAWGAGEKSRINAHPPETRTDYREFIASADRPVIAHEIGQWCVYPNFEEIAKYTGHLKPHNFEIFRDFLNAEGLGEQAREFLMASGKLQVACYKEEIESALRTPGYAGFALLGLTDFPGQGTALVGVLDAFWDAKSYVDAATFRRFCGPTVPLARLDRRCFTTDQTVDADLELAHYGPRDLKNTKVEWKIENAATTETVEQGHFEVTVPTGTLTPIGHVSVRLASVAAPAKVRLIVSVPEAGAENDWDLWVYPPGPPAEVPPLIHVCSELDETARRHLRAGGKLLLTLPPDRIATNRVLGFSSIFWNTSWTGNQVPHTLGILCDPQHPLFGEFPTEAYSNWQWWDLIHGAATMELDKAAFSAVDPLVQVVPDWFDPKKLALAFEARVGGGSALVTSMDLTSNLENRHAARQFRSSLLNYMAGKQFRPTTELTVEQIEALVR